MQRFPFKTAQKASSCKPVCHKELTIKPWVCHEYIERQAGSEAVVFKWDVFNVSQCFSVLSHIPSQLPSLSEVKDTPLKYLLREVAGMIC